MKKYIFYFLIILTFGVLVYSYYFYLQSEKQKSLEISLVVENFNKTAKYIQQKYNGNYPIPDGDLILLDKTNSMIHLDNRNIVLNKIKNLEIIQGTTCDILKNDKEFNKINFDGRFSILDKSGNSLQKRCFTYSVDKNGKYFQIATVIKKNKKYETVLLGNSPKSMTKSYDSTNLVIEGSSDFLPYAPYKFSPILKVENLEDSNLIVKISPRNNVSYNFELKDGINTLLSGHDSFFDINILGKISPKTILKFIDVNGNIIFIKGNSEDIVNFGLNNYSPKTSDLNYFFETGKFFANIVRLDSDKNMFVKKDGLTLTVRGTKFSVISEQNSIANFLINGSIEQEFNGKKYNNLNSDNLFSFINTNSFSQDINRILNILSFSIFSDTLLNKDKTKTLYTEKIGNFVTDIHSGRKNLERIQLSYGDGQKIGFILFKKSDYFLSYINQNFNKSLDNFGKLLNQICKANNFGKGLDITKFNYLLNVNNDDSFVLKDKLLDIVGYDKYFLPINIEIDKNNHKLIFLNGLEKRLEFIDNFNYLNIDSLNNLENIIFTCEI